MTYTSLNKDAIFAFGVTEDIIKQVEIEIKYEGFIQMQLRDVERFKRIEKIKIPENF